MATLFAVVCVLMSSLAGIHHVVRKRHGGVHDAVRAARGVGCTRMRSLGAVIAMVSAHRFAANTTITQATEVFVSEEHHYPSGFNVTVLPAGAQTWSYDQFVDKVSGIVSFTHATWLEQGADVVIEIRPSAA